jgi:hypothetical protein
MTEKTKSRTAFKDLCNAVPVVGALDVTKYFLKRGHTKETLSKKVGSYRTAARRNGMYLKTDGGRAFLMTVGYAKNQNFTTL